MFSLSPLNELKEGKWNRPDQVKNVLERKSNGQLRFCKVCALYKPDRAHHCRKAGKCVLKMDHHSPWHNNTIGFGNHKFFYLGIFYGSCALLTWLVLMLPSSSSSALNIFGWLLAALLSVPTVPYFLFLTRLLLTGYTTIEWCEKRQSDRGCRHKEAYQKSPYDCGVVRNVCEALGPNPLLWLLPTTRGMRRDGDTFLNVEDLSKSHCDVHHPLVVEHLRKHASAAAVTTGQTTTVKEEPEGGGPEEQQKKKDR